jgi:hypothetical protein
MRIKAWLAGVILSAAFTACGDDSGYQGDAGSVDNDATIASVAIDAVAAQNSFSSSACKKDTAAKVALAHLRKLNVIDSEAGLDGLRCVAWERVGTNELKLDLYNFDAACGALWTGDGVVAADGTLALHVNNPSCQIAKCGICLYDWSFDLHLSVAANQAVALDIAVDACEGQQSTQRSSAVIGPEAKGIRCTLAHYGAMNWQATAAGTCGKAGMPCVGSLLCGSGSFTSTGTCADDLVCDSSSAVNEPVCFVPCTTVADCPRADVYGCQAGLCRPTSLGF